jgi:hypothetical protein
LTNCLPNYAAYEKKQYKKKAKFLEKYQQLEQRVQEAEKQTVSSAISYIAISKTKGLKAIESPQRPKAGLSDPLYFEGDKAEWRGWKLEIENKLSKDSQILGDELF